jgi:hypothetical protein
MNNLKKVERTAFSVWMRTGRWPRRAQELELKFNPWHDPRDGRFTFGPGGPRSKNQNKPAPKKSIFKVDSRLPRMTTIAELDAWKASLLKKYGHWRGYPEDIEEKYQEFKKDLPAPPPPKSTLNKGKDFATGFGEGVYDVGKGTAKGIYSLATTNPATSIRNAELGAAGLVDAALKAEDTPGYIQLERAKATVAHASAKDWGHSTGVVAGNAALAVVPAAAVGKALAIARARGIETIIVPRGPPKVTWVDETPTFSGKTKVQARAYNDSARGARSSVVTKKGQAPALERTMPDGTKRLVKFDGVDFDPVYGHVMIDRKWSIVMRQNLKDQALRQSQALSQNNLIGIWEVPTKSKLRQAIKLLEKLGISNIKVRIIKL